MSLAKGRLVIEPQPQPEHALTPRLLEEACAPWQIAPESLRLVGESENLVYEGLAEGQARVLRITHHDHRRPADIEAELDFVRFLAQRGQPVCRALPSSVAREWHAVGDRRIACCFERARGELAVPSDPERWNERLFQHWGRTLAGFHECARVYLPPAGRAARYQWFEDDLFAGQHLPLQDDDLREQLAELTVRLRARPTTARDYGLIHADLHDNNFFASAAGELSVFDFDDACQHWYSFDLAVVAHQLPGTLAERQLIWSAIVAGYAEVAPLPAEFQAEMSLMFRLRSLQLLQFAHKMLRRASSPERQARLRMFAAGLTQKIRAGEPFDLKP